MYSRRYIWPALTILAAGEGHWVYDWPYGAKGECRCKEIPVPTAGHPEQGACLKALAEEPYEYCWSEDTSGRIGGITETDCANYAVSTYPTVTNLDCEAACLKVVVGTLPLADFTGHCKLEIVAKSVTSVAPLPSGCFVNFVLGHTDYNPAKSGLPPLRIIPEVESAAKCQVLCQQIDACAWFQWRAVADDECNHGLADGFQRPPQDCELYDFAYVEKVLNFNVNSLDINASSYAGGVCDIEQYEDRECSDLFKTSSWNPFAPIKCLSCDCEPRCAFTSLSHISGPAYCEGSIETNVCNIRPPFAHTTPPPECPTSLCDTTPTEHIDRVRPPTQPTFTTQPGKTTGHETVPEWSTTTGFETTINPIVTTAGMGMTTTTTLSPGEAGTSTTGLETTVDETTTGLITTTEFETTTLPPHPSSAPGQTTGKVCPPCPPCDHCQEGDESCECKCPPCIDPFEDNNWEAEDMMEK